ncbi:MAG: hypothetical protein ABIW84_01555 [Ilumatobacteraceae bacterium]
MIVTAQDMYQFFLTELNKEFTGSVFPDEFERLINTVQIDFVENRYYNVEMSEKRIDDLRILMVIDEVIFNTGPNIAGQEVFLLPYNPNGFVTTPKNPTGTNHGYMFLLAVAFKLQYVKNKCGLTGLSEVIKSKPMRSDKRHEVKRDPFNRPTDERVYYQESGDRLILYTGTSSYGAEAHIDYLRYPRDISILSNPNVDCELPLHARQEMVRMAVKRKLEEIQSPRYQSNTIENNQVIT